MKKFSCVLLVILLFVTFISCGAKVKLIKYLMKVKVQKKRLTINQWMKIKILYGVLKTQLSKTEMSNLEKEEVQWIKDKQAKAEASAAEWEGGD